jgi:hypothetical protein
LTSLNNQPKGQVEEGVIGIYDLCRYSRQKLKIILLITSSLVKVPGRPFGLPVFQRSAGQ